MAFVILRNANGQRAATVLSYTLAWIPSAGVGRSSGVWSANPDRFGLSASI